MGRLSAASGSCHNSRSSSKCEASSASSHTRAAERFSTEDDSSTCRFAETPSLRPRYISLFLEIYTPPWLSKENSKGCVSRTFDDDAKGDERVCVF